MKRSHQLRRNFGTAVCAPLVLAAFAVQGPASAVQTGLAGGKVISPVGSSAAPAWKPQPTPPTCGATIYKAGGAAWKCTFADEFSGTSLDTSKWVPQETATNGYTSGEGCVVNSPDNVSSSNGTLKLTVRKEAAPFTCKSPLGNFTTQYSAGGVMSYGKFSQTYGRFEFRAKFPGTQVPGVQTALWLYPTSASYGAWPASGEIDVAEYYSQYPDRAIPYLHYNTPSSLSSDTTGVTNWYCTMIDPSVFHTYVAEWTSKGIKISYDGTTCIDHVWNPSLPLLAPKPFDKPFAIIMTQVLGIATNAFDASTTPLPATSEVDWVHVWS